MRKGDFRIVTEVPPPAALPCSAPAATLNRRLCPVAVVAVVVVQKLDGDLEGLIHDHEKPLSLFVYGRHSTFVGKERLGWAGLGWAGLG